MHNTYSSHTHPQSTPPDRCMLQSRDRSSLLTPLCTCNLWNSLDQIFLLDRLRKKLLSSFPCCGDEVCKKNTCTDYNYHVGFHKPHSQDLSSRRREVEKTWELSFGIFHDVNRIYINITLNDNFFYYECVRNSSWRQDFKSTMYTSDVVFP